MFTIWINEAFYRSFIDYRALSVRVRVDWAMRLVYGKVFCFAKAYYNMPFDNPRNFRQKSRKNILTI